MIKLQVACVIVGVCISYQAAWAGTPDYLNAGAAYERTYPRAHREPGVAANGRCDGVSYGTGARRCGTATGGPVGGRN